MPPVLNAVFFFAAIVILILIQTNLKRLKSPIWGFIPPLIVFGAAVYAHFFLKIELTVSTVLIFAVPFVWSIRECYRGRMLRNSEEENNPEESN